MRQETLTDVLFDVQDGLATITINRPERYNAFRNRTLDELIWCFKWAWADPTVGVVSLTGAGDKAFCAGGDQKERAIHGDYGPSEWGMMESETLHRLIWDIPKPVIAAVNGVAIGGGHVLHVICDLSIAADTARFGQVGPKVGSFDAGFGSVYLARVVGAKRAREIWYLCDQYDAATAERWGLVNKVVRPHQLKTEVRTWADKLLQRSPTALRILKHSMNLDQEPTASSLAFDALHLYAETDEAHEGGIAFAEKRAPDFARWRGMTL
jgi:2-ketocyclohexanecarboxyl-CoA hydrolase